MIGLPVIHKENGKTIGRVEDVLFHAPNGKLIGFVLVGGSWWSGYPIYPVEEVLSIGTSAIMADNASAVLTTTRQKKMAELKENAIKAVGYRVLDADGDDLGVIDDVFFDPREGKVIGYQLSRGVIHDVIYGKEYLAFTPRLHWGEDVAILHCTD